MGQAALQRSSKQLEGLAVVVGITQVDEPVAGATSSSWCNIVDRLQRQAAQQSQKKHLGYPLGTPQTPHRMSQTSEFKMISWSLG